MYTLKYKLFWFGICILFMLTTRPAAAQLDLVFNKNIFVQQPGDIFSVAATVTNPLSNNNLYTLDNYFLTASPIGGSSNLSLGTDITEDPTGFFTTFARSYAPGESASGNMFDFALSNMVPAGQYTINVSLRDSSNTPLGQSSFELDIAPVPELNSVLSLGGLMMAGGLSFWHQRRGHSTVRSQKAKTTGSLFRFWHHAQS